MNRLLSSLPLVALAAACSQGGGGPRPGEELAPPMFEAHVLPECPDFDYTPCDIRELVCQQQLRELAACVYGRDPAGGVSLELMDEAAYAAVILEDWADIPEGGPPHFYRALSVLNLAQPKVSSKADGAAELAKLYGGVYRGDEKRIVIIDHGYPADAASANATLVHEFVHSMQDADYDFASWPQGVDDTTFDGFLATDTVIEGEAKLLQYRAVVPMLGLDIGAVDFWEAMNSQLSLAQGQALFSDTPYSTSFTSFPYGFGAAQAFDANRKGRAGREALWASPPSTTQQVMSRLFATGTEQPQGVEIREPEAAGLTLDSQDVLGAWGIQLFLFANEVVDRSSERAIAWRGDHFWVYTDETGTFSFGLWQLELETEADAVALAEDFARVAGEGSEHEASGTRVFVSFGYAAQGASPELTAWGRAWLAE